MDSPFHSECDKPYNFKSMAWSTMADIELQKNSRLNPTHQTSSDANVPRFPQGLTQLINESDNFTFGGSEDMVESSQRPEDIDDMNKSITEIQELDKLVANGESQDDGASSQNKTSALKELIGGSEVTQTQDLALLCSGQFTSLTNVQDTQTAAKEMNKLFNSAASVPENIADLCSGQFSSLTSLQDTQTATKEMNKLFNSAASAPENIADLCSGQFSSLTSLQDTQTVTKEMNKLFNSAASVSENIADLCSGQFVTQNETQGKPHGLENLITSSLSSLPTNLEDICSGQFITQKDCINTQGEKKQGDETVTVSKDDHEDSKPNATEESSRPRIEMRIVSDDEDDGESKVETNTRKGKRKLAFSDDEDDDQEAAEDEDSEEEEEAKAGTQALEEEDGYVDYDSEENEIQARPQDFFEAEAELSGEEEWGSADEDEAGLDFLDEEQGDKEKIDEQELASQLGKIHARRMLDDDKRDVRLLQEAFLEDGDLFSENGGRQRLFRWKKTDDDGTWVAGAQPNLSGDEAEDEDEGEAESNWRSARLERETWLLKNKDKVTEDGPDDNSQLLQLGRSLLAKMGAGRMKPPQPVNITSIPKSPGKAILQALKRKSGSFLARKRISMTHVVALAGTEGDSGCMVSSSSRNFVFTTLSPGSNKGPDDTASNAGEEEIRPQPVVAKKRPMNIRPGNKLQPAAKKKKVTANSVFQLLN